AAHFDAASNRWLVQTSTGERVTARFCIMATGCLSTPNRPNFKGLDSFQGSWYHTAMWPHEGVDFTGQRVGVIGTGSSAIQSIPVIAEQASQLYVFQRTPNFSLPAQNRMLTPEERQEVKANYATIRHKARTSGFGLAADANNQSALEVSDEERQRTYQSYWNRGGLSIMVSYNDLILNKESNDTAAEFVRERIREIVHDPQVAELLTPKDYPIATKRVCIDTGYFQTFNRPNVTLVDVRSDPIEEITPTGLRTGQASYELDSIVFATGFDAMTGTLVNIDIRGSNGESLKETWASGPRTYLGLMSAGFPNLFLITGPGSPSVLSNMAVSIEQHVDWVADCVAYLRNHDYSRIEATPQAEENWVAHVNEMGNYTLYPLANSWYMGANIPGKPRVFLPYIGGVGNYRATCDEVVAKGYEGFALSA
nr:NAD(P)/FAD-dependent oxidoreductase [Chloroflexaceae bacterium]